MHPARLTRRGHSAPEGCRRSASVPRPTASSYGIPDVLGARRSRYAGRRVLVVGSGHSALNALLDLAHLAESEPNMVQRN